MIRFLFLFVFLFSFILLSGQKHDNMWTFGYDGHPDYPQFGASNLSFEFSPPIIIPSDRSLWISGTNASLCDPQGDFLAFSNGIAIFDKFDNMIPGSDSLNPGGKLDDNYELGYPTWYGAFFLPKPNNKDEYYLFHMGGEPEIKNLYKNLYFTELSFSSTDGKGIVTSKNNLIFSGSFEPTSACKHANGRDWWLLVPEAVSCSNKKYTFLVTPDSITQPKSQNIGSISSHGFTGGLKNGFSRDGSVYVLMDAYFGIQFYDFDRCTGELSNFRMLSFEQYDNWYAGNFEFSPNGQFFYFNTDTELLQIDLNETINWDNVDTVGVYDGFIEWNARTIFSNQQLGPDDKIYLSCLTTAPYLHVIHEPNKKGTACNFQQHAIRLAGRHSRSLPYFPNYRLGALEGSGCDSIVSSIHSEITNKSEYKVYPNPTSGKITIEVENLLKGASTFELFDFTGKQLRSIGLSSHLKNQRLELFNQPPGIYFYKIQSENSLLKSGKLIIN